jgi:uncharacterized protein
MMKFLFVVLSCAFFCIGCSAKTAIQSSIEKFPANGVSGGAVVCTLAGGDVKITLTGGQESVVIVAREREELTEKIYFRSTRKPGIAVFASTDGAKLSLTFYKSSIDIDGDGFPDSAELETEGDRTAFSEWFVRVAESQFLKKNGSWNANERDCAGLVRYAYREALKIHDDRWQRKSGIVIDKNLPDVERFHYPDVPFLGEKLFKVKKGDADDLSTFSSFADARTLLTYNVIFVSKNIVEARKGDLLFFQLESNDSPWHSMIVTDAGAKTLVYHTGRGDLVKRIELSYLSGSAFEPSERNNRFLGVYRFHILE